MRAEVDRRAISTGPFPKEMQARIPMTQMLIAWSPLQYLSNRGARGVRVVRRSYCAHVCTTSSEDTPIILHATVSTDWMSAPLVFCQQTFRCGGWTGVHIGHVRCPCPRKHCSQTGSPDPDVERSIDSLFFHNLNLSQLTHT